MLAETTAPGRTYARRRPEETALTRAVRDGLPGFERESEARHASGLPAFVRQEFENFLGCGDLRRGFARFQCTSCGTDRFVALSCGGRGFCPSCLGRRMVESAANLVDYALPRVPIRHWILSLPFELRTRLAWDHKLCRSVLAIFIDRLLGFLTQKAGAGQRRGQARSGVVTVIQRAGSAGNLNVHFHTLALDGAFSLGSRGQMEFAAIRSPTADEIGELTESIHEGVVALLSRRGLLALDTRMPEADFSPDAPELAGLYAASVRELVAVGERAGQKPFRLRSAATALKVQRTGKRSARFGGFDLCATAVIPVTHRDRLEKVARYLLRPPIPESHLEYDGKLVILKLPTPRSDGTTALAFEPADFVARLAALVIRPRVNQILYHGILAPNANLRREALRFGRPPQLPLAEESDKPQKVRPSRSWAELMKRGMGLDVLACPKCSGRLRYIATIMDRTEARRILEHVGLWDHPAADPPPARAPPAEASAAANPNSMAAKLARLRTKIA